MFEHVVNILFALAVFLAAFGIGTLLLKPLKKLFIFNSLEENEGKLSYELSIILLMLGLGLLSLLTFVIGIIGLLYKLLFVIIVIAFAVIGLRYLIKIPKVKVPRYTFGETLAIAMLAILAIYNLLASLTPELFYDSQLYHLGLPNQWIQNKAITSNLYYTQSFYPFNINMLYMVGMILHNEITSKLIHYFCGIFLCISIYHFAKKYFSQTIAVFSVLIFYSVPNVIIASWKSGVELGIGIFEFGTLLTIVNYFSSKNKNWLVIAGALCGFAIGSKYTSISFCLIPTVVSVVVFGIMEKYNYKEIFKDLLIFSSFTLLTSFPWYLRTIIASGNPVFPYLNDVIGFLDLKGHNIIMPAPAYTIRNYLFFLWPLTMEALQEETWPGIIFLLFAPILFLFKQIDRRIKLMIIYFIVSLLFWMFIGKMYLRFFIPSLAMISVIFSYYIFNQKTGKTFKTIMLLMVLVATFLNFRSTNKMYFSSMDVFLYFLGSISEKDYLSKDRPVSPNPYYHVLDYAENNLSQDSKILFLGELRGLYCSIRYVSHGPVDYNPFVEWVKQSNTAEELKGRLTKEGVTHILFNYPEAYRLSGYDIFYFDKRDLVVLDEFWNRYVKEIFSEIGDVSIFKKNIYSLKKQQPDEWARYNSNPRNRVYLYKILHKYDIQEKHMPPLNPFFDKEIFSKSRLETLK